MHRNAVLKHLDALVRDGVVKRETMDGSLFYTRV